MWEVWCNSLIYECSGGHGCREECSDDLEGWRFGGFGGSANAWRRPSSFRAASLCGLMHEAQQSAVDMSYHSICVVGAWRQCGHLSKPVVMGCFSVPNMTLLFPAIK